MDSSAPKRFTNVRIVKSRATKANEYALIIIDRPLW